MNYKEKNLLALFAENLFGFGLTLSAMVNPERVLNFLDLLGDWHPALASIMGAAIPVSAIGYLPAGKPDRPFLGERFLVPHNLQTDKQADWRCRSFRHGPGYCRLLSGSCRRHAVAAVAGTIGLTWFSRCRVVHLSRDKVIIYFKCRF